MVILYASLFNSIFVSSTDVEQHIQERSFASLLSRFGIHAGYFPPHYPYNNIKYDKDVAIDKKRDMRKKWSQIFQDSQSSYAIAFPALIRTRRWIEHEE
ncbi:unnamed protein product [Adineta steineri]|uniref:Uncharacterized protein n=1 Tax=Adineta steineri TaxID=433720 RepID=A0A819MYZ8_9BILA|nr:unnamed protein product [Adineta steineri]CAF0803431.1 unnamed protein product [Adineta steineri]CAF3524366.1 unnamed protein product [Adineta steineri]CAF3987216.1 unnamed protein product [Adineta steineri]